MTLYTGTGDSGTTKLYTCPEGQRVSKTAPVFEALGMLDELNSLVGWCKVEARTSSARIGKRSMGDVLHEIQDCLFTIQAEVAGADKKMPKRMVTAAERAIAFIEAHIPPITSFVVPGGNELSARLDIARAVSRRVERCVLSVHESGERPVGVHTRVYMNRLSSLLYALARLANTAEGVTEVRPEYRST